MKTYKLPLKADLMPYTAIWDNENHHIAVCSSKEHATSLVLAANHFDEAEKLLNFAVSELKKWEGYHQWDDESDGVLIEIDNFLTKLKEAQDG
jgi:hypothetical protein